MLGYVGFSAGVCVAVLASGPQRGGGPRCAAWAGGGYGPSRLKRGGGHRHGRGARSLAVDDAVEVKRYGGDGHRRGPRGAERGRRRRLRRSRLGLGEVVMAAVAVRVGRSRFG